MAVAVVIASIFIVLLGFLIPSRPRNGRRYSGRRRNDNDDNVTTDTMNSFVAGEFAVQDTDLYGMIDKDK